MNLAAGRLQPRAARSNQKRAGPVHRGNVMDNTHNQANEVLVDCRSVWKIFGTRAAAAIEAVEKRGLSK